jgi:alpha-methylacyl-CoA racemase
VAGLGASPFGCMLLADMGADVIRVDRLGPGAAAADFLGRGRRSAGLDLKTTAGLEVLLRLAGTADVLVEAFRPGVAERLGFGPEACLARNPRLVYTRLTGWGQDGPLATAAGHDIDYIALSGALHLTGPAGGKPVPPVNMIGDFGGGGMLAVIGVLAALVERERSGLGQVVDAAMVDGSALLTTMFHGMRAAGLWTDDRGANLLDGGAPFYDTYETADGRFMAVGALEPRFYAEFVTRLGLDPAELAELPDRGDPASWPELRGRFAAAFRRRTRDEWAKVFEGTDACVAPVLTLGEAPLHPHNQARSVFVSPGGVTQPGPAPRFGRTPAGPPGPPVPPGADTAQVLADLGYTADEIAGLRAAGAIG